jgi:hypothetical protein
MDSNLPIEPGSGRKGGCALKGCLLGCLIAAVVVVLLAITAALFVGWRLTREAPPAPTLSLRDGRETFYLHARLRPDDPGVGALGERLIGAWRDAQRARASGGDGAERGWIDAQHVQGWRQWLPLELDVARAPRAAGAADATVVAVRFEAMAGTVRALFRIVAFLVPAREGGPVRRADIGGTPAIVATPGPDPSGPTFALALAGEHLVGALSHEDLRAALTAASSPPSAEDEPATLARSARLEDEDGWGYARPRAPAAADGIRIAAFSFDLVSDDLVRWRAALRGAQAPADREASAQALVAALAGVRLPAGLALTLDRTTRWVDERTLVVDGTVDGFAAWAGRAFSDEPGTEPANPTP